MRCRGSDVLSLVAVRAAGERSWLINNQQGLRHQKKPLQKKPVIWEEALQLPGPQQPDLVNHPVGRFRGGLRKQSPNRSFPNQAAAPSEWKPVYKRRKEMWFKEELVVRSLHEVVLRNPQNLQRKLPLDVP